MGTPVDAEALHRRGVDLANRGSYSAARRVLKEALATADRIADVNLLARTAGTMAYVLARTGEVDAGEQLCLDMLAREGLDAVTVAQLHGQLGALALERGLPDEAVEWLTKGVEGLSDHPVRQANVLMNRGLVEMDRGRLAAARKDLEAAERIYRASGLPDEANQAVHNLGYLAMRRGDLVSALAMMQSVRDPLNEESDVWAAINELDRAEVLRDAGLVSEAEQLLASAAAVLGRERAPRERAGAEYQLARSLLTHAPERSAVVARAAARRFRAVGSDGWAIRADAVRLRALLDDGRTTGSPLGGGPRRRVPGVGEVDSVAERLTSHGFRVEAAALRLSFELAQARHGRADAKRTSVPRSAPLDTQLLNVEVLAARATLRGRHGLARRHLAAGLDLLALWQESGSIDLQSAIQMHGGPLVYAGIDSAVRSGRADLIFEWSERARHLSQQVVPLRPPPDPEAAQDVAELRALRAESDSEDWLSQPRTAAIRERVRQRQWSSTRAAALEQRVDLAELQEVLPADAALLAFVFTGAVLSSVVVRRGSAVVVPMPPISEVRRSLTGLRADLDMSATIRSGPMAKVVQRSLEERLAALADLLLAEPLRVAGADRIVLTVPGVLREVPWGMLPGLRDRPFTVAVSATRWVRFARAPRPAPDTAGFVAGPRVARGVEEVTRAAAPWSDPIVECGRGATAQRLTEVATGVDVLHIAAHGRHSADNPMFSGLELADGILFGYDIDLIDRVPDTIILSACEVGRSSIRWGEEAIGMTRVWLHAGARCVIAAPVVVADDDACELLSAMHEGLAAGVAPSVALAEASQRTGIVAPFQVHGAGF